MRRSLRILFALLAVSLFALAACGSDHDDMSMSGADKDGAMGDDMGHDGGHGDTSEVADGARRIEVTARSFAFDPAEITVTAGEDIAIVLTSEDLLHDFTIDELDAHVAADKGETSEGGLRADEPGRYTYYCEVPGHREAGMEGTLIVEAS